MSNMTKVLIKFHDNYADEFDVEGHKVFDLKEWNDHLTFAKDLSYPREIYFGTNEFCEYYNYEAYLRCFDLKILSDNEYETLSNLALLESGTFLMFDPDFENEEEL